MRCRGVVQLGLDQLGLRLDRRADFAAVDDRPGDHRHRFASADVLVGEQEEFREFEEVPVLHVELDAVVFLAPHQRAGLGVAVHRIGKIVCAVQEHHRHLRRTDVARRIPKSMPFVRLRGGHFAKLTNFPDAIFLQETAPVDRHGHRKSIIHPGNDAGQVAAPTDPGQRDVIAIHPGETAQQ